jgi:serine/threonine-protein kinase
VYAWFPRAGGVSAYYATPLGAAVGLTAWMVATIGATVVVSGVVYGLTQRVRQAMQLGQYTLEERIGEGGMGVVYRARHALLRRPTAIKLLPRAHPSAVARFEREAQRTAELASPHIVAVYDFGRTAEGVLYYAMEYLDGLDLESVVRAEGPLPPGRVLHVMKHIAEALSEAHEIGLVHRDVKPANVMLTTRPRSPDHAKLLDLGIVHEVDGRGPDNAGLSGTPLYMAPETFGGEEIDDRADVYALGATAYMLLTGSPPFEGTSVLALAEEHAKKRPASPSMRLGREVPRSLEAAVLACLAKAPDERPETAEALLEQLEACADVPPWTDDDARRWWATRAPAIRGTSRRAPDQRTVGVALDARA